MLISFLGVVHIDSDIETITQALTDKIRSDRDYRCRDDFFCFLCLLCTTNPHRCFQPPGRGLRRILRRTTARSCRIWLRLLVVSLLSFNSILFWFDSYCRFHPSSKARVARIRYISFSTEDLKYLLPVHNKLVEERNSTKGE